MTTAIGLWLIYEAIIFLICWLEDEMKLIIPISLFITLICVGAYLLAP